MNVARNKYRHIVLIADAMPANFKSFFIHTTTKPTIPATKAIAKYGLGSTSFIYSAYAGLFFEKEMEVITSMPEKLSAGKSALSPEQETVTNGKKKHAMPTKSNNLKLDFNFFTSLLLSSYQMRR